MAYSNLNSWISRHFRGLRWCFYGNWQVLSEIFVEFHDLKILADLFLFICEYGILTFE